MIRSSGQTLEINDEVLDIARRMAGHQKQSIGKVVPMFFAKDLKGPASDESVRNGLRVIQRGPNSTAVALDIVNKPRDEL